MDLMELLGQKKSLSEHLKPLKDRIEKTLGKTIESYQIGVDMQKSEFRIQADGKHQTEKSKMMCMMISTFLKKALKKRGKENVSFSNIMLHITDKSVAAAVKLTTNEIETLELSSSEVVSV